MMARNGYMYYETAVEFFNSSQKCVTYVFVILKRSESLP